MLKDRLSPHHPALEPGRLAVVTGAASGIGFAAAERFAKLGLRVILADINADGLAEAVARVCAVASDPAFISPFVLDVSQCRDLEMLKAYVADRYGHVDVLMNNAGREGSGGLFSSQAGWQAILDVNLWGTLYGCQLFAPAMAESGRPGLIINTGSKQGITTPPGDTAYNVSKAGVKIITEALAHELRNWPGCRVTAHLLIPGFTFTGFTRRHSRVKPPGAWEPSQVIDELLQGIARQDFYILCPDNEVTRDLDEKRIRWAAEDLIKNRPALSRWHPDYKDAFATYLNTQT